MPLLRSLGGDVLLLAVDAGRKGEVEAALGDFVMGGKFLRVCLPLSESPEKRG